MLPPIHWEGMLKGREWLAKPKTCSEKGEAPLKGPLVRPGAATMLKLLLTWCDVKSSGKLNSSVKLSRNW